MQKMISEKQTFIKGYNNAHDNINYDNSEIKHTLFSLDVECSVLGMILLEKNAIQQVVPLINKKEVFYKSLHQDIFECMLSLYNSNIIIDTIVVVEWLRKCNRIDAETVREIVSLTNNVVSSTNIDQHCIILLDYYQRRELIVTAKDTLVKCYQNEDTFDIIDIVEQRLTEMTSNIPSKDFKDANIAGAEVLDDIFKRRHNPTSSFAIPTGYPILDRHLNGGFEGGQLVVIGARPSVGKSALALNIAYSAMKYTTVGYFSLEMGPKEQMQRYISLDKRIPLERIKNGNLSDGEIDSIQDSIGNAGTRILFDCSSNLSPLLLSSKVRRLYKENGAKMIIIDHIGLMTPSNTRGTKAEQIEQITNALKRLSMELEITIIALCQLSRESEKQNRPTRLSDLRDSGSIEQDADIVLAPHRDDYRSDSPVDPSLKGLAYIAILKNRSGKTTEGIPIPFTTDFSIQKWTETDLTSAYKSNGYTDYSQPRRNDEDYF